MSRISDSWEESESRERKVRFAYGFVYEGYEEAKCNNPDCGRQRVGLRNNGKLICEKCCWDQVDKVYDGAADC